MIWLALSTAIQAKPLDADLLYFILVDRFSNGNPENDIAIDLNDPQAFHGGDLPGIIKKLPYIQSLGADAIWLSPIFHMRTKKFAEHGAFHGYWVQDLDKIEPAFGGEEALKELSSQTQEKGMTLIMDMVYNHVSFDSPLRYSHKHWFHEEKTIENWDDPYERTHYMVHGLPDLNQSNEEVYTYLRQRSFDWKEKANLGGFRIDAIRHMENDFISRLSKDIHNNDDNMWLLGEDFQGNPVELIERANATGLDALFDFPTYYAMTDLFCKQGSIGAFASTLWLDRQYPKDFQLVTFLDNHDLPRLHSSCSPEKAMQALFTQFSIRGLPMITYGTELGLTGAHEPENRADMPWGVESPSQKMITTMTALRKKYPVLKNGTGIVEHLNEQSMVYTQYLDDTSATLVINNADTPLSYTHPIDTCFTLDSKMVFSPCSSQMIPAHSSRVWIDTKKQPSRKKMRSDIIVSPCSLNQDLRIVGSSPEIGGWNPHKGLKLVHREDSCQASLLLPKNAVLRFKIVDVQEKKVEWGTGPDHILWNTNEKRISWTP